MCIISVYIIIKLMSLESLFTLQVGRGSQKKFLFV